MARALETATGGTQEQDRADQSRTDRPGVDVLVTACSVVPRNRLRASSEMRQMGLILHGTPEEVTQTLARKALGGGTPAVHHAS